MSSKECCRCHQRTGLTLLTSGSAITTVTRQGPKARMLAQPPRHLPLWRSPPMKLAVSSRKRCPTGQETVWSALSTCWWTAHRCAEPQSGSLHRRSAWCACVAETLWDLSRKKVMFWVCTHVCHCVCAHACVCVCVRACQRLPLCVCWWWCKCACVRYVVECFCWPFLLFFFFSFCCLFLVFWGSGNRGLKFLLASF